jgi:hypothetical protein
LQKYVESPLSIRLLEGEFSEGDKILVEVDEGANELMFRQAGLSINVEELGEVSVE